MGCKRKQWGPPKGGQNNNLGPRKLSPIARSIFAKKMGGNFKEHLI